MPRATASAVFVPLLLVLLAATTVPPCSSAGEPDREFQMIQAGSGLTLHKEMFMLPYTYSDEYNGRRTEAVFQVSAKYRVFSTRVFVAYTQISFWQAYDSPNSSPFRDTNYNPEIFYRSRPFACRSSSLGADAGIEHESNGQQLPLSRSWNLAYVSPWYRRGDLLLYLKLRYRFPEDDKTSPDDAMGDDNPDITDYLGYSDVHLYYRFAGAHQIHLTLRGVIGSGKGNASLTYSLPLPRTEGSYLMLRLFHGYGESLMDYRKSISRVGIGLMFAR